MSFLNKLLNWYFNKKSLPYWCLFLVDSIIVLFSGLFTYWIFNRTMEMFTHRFDVLYTSLFYVVISWIGARVFRTYSGVVRYSSFVDLQRVAYANLLSVIIAIISSLALEQWDVKALTAFNQTDVAATFSLAMLLMWGIRIIVKNLNDLTKAENNTIRVLIYGAMTGGIGLAKNIRSQNPAKFKLCGFISHDSRAKHMMLMGEKVYNVEDDIAEIIQKEKIEAVLVSPLRLSDFRDNQEFQDLLIKAGVKIFFAQQAKEANLKDGELTEEDFAGMQLKEVFVEDLLPRQEIKVDMDSVGAMLTGKKVLITGSAGSIGSEIVRQIAVYKPAKMMLIDPGRDTTA